MSQDTSQGITTHRTVARFCNIGSRFFAAIVASSLMVMTATADSGVISVTSKHDVKTTIDKLTTVLESKGMTIFARVNHAAGAEKAGMSLPATELLIFGNPKAGTPLMKCARSIGLDLPQKMLAWEADDGKVYLSFNDPVYLKSRHTVSGCDKNFGKISGALNNFAKAATN